MKNCKRDFLSRRHCLALKSLLAIILNTLALTIISLPSLGGGKANGFYAGVPGKTATDRFALTVSGKITDDKGNPVGEVTIAERDTDNMSMSKADGSFSLTVVNEKAKLVFSK